MSDILGSAGNLAEGALWSHGLRSDELVDERATAPAATDGHNHESACLNCGTTLVGPHCHGCGQHAHVHRTAGAFLHDLLHGALHWEGRTWRTLPLLATRPGELTRRYIEGERTRFVSPMALFLFSVFLMFAVFQIAGVATPADIPGEQDSAGTLAAARENIAEERSELERQLGQVAADDPRRAGLSGEIERLRTVGEQLGSAESFFTKSGTNGAAVGPTASPFLNKGIAKFRENPSLMLYKLQANSYKFSWLLIPLSIPFVALLFAWRRRFGAYDHAVFVTYSLSFMTLLFVVLTLLGWLGVGSALLGLAAMLIPPVHIYRQLKSGYQLRRASALWRTGALLVLIAIVLALFLNLLLLLGFIG